jgi:hypothetical protein
VFTVDTKKQKKIKIKRKEGKSYVIKLHTISLIILCKGIHLKKTK